MTKQTFTPDKPQQFESSLLTQFLDLMKNGTVPWRLPFEQMPYNYQNGYIYTNSNAWACFMHMHAKRYTSARYITFNGLQQLNTIRHKADPTTMPILIRKGEHGLPLLRINRVRIDRDDPESPTRSYAAGFVVFNEAQLSNTLVTEAIRPSFNDPIPHLTSCYPKPLPTFTSETGNAYYRKSSDTVNIPPFSSFYDDNPIRNYAMTCGHELFHSTGHARRLNRLELVNTEQTDINYGTEELAAEIAATLCTRRLGLSPDMPASADYLRQWMKAISATPAILFDAIHRATEGVEYLMGPFNPTETAELVHNI